MKQAVVYLCFVVFTLLSGTVAVQAQDAQEQQDTTLFSKMPNYQLTDVDEKEFDAYDFKVKGEQGEDVANPVEGRYVRYVYRFDDAGGATIASRLQVVRNYQTAALEKGGEVLFEDTYSGLLTLRFADAGKETWVEVNGGDWEINLVIVEKQQMRQDIVSSGTAATFKEGLTRSGHVEVPGILFDFGKAELKPEADTVLKEVAKLLRENEALKVWVVGHTDNVGTAEYNLDLSNARAASVVAALTQRMGIDARRLASFGAGPYAPVSSNKEEAGRTLNRRVELVEQ
jgi:outer membrane protein OmpA-like peptidoglycan-associated protein